jgi:hypothetical protein
MFDGSCLSDRLAARAYLQLKGQTMKRTILMIALICFGVICSVSIAVSEPQQNKQTLSTSPKTPEPLSRLAGDWRVTYFVMGGGIATFGNCDVTKIDLATDNSIGLALQSLPCPHQTVKSWEFHLKPTANKKGYLLTLKGGYGSSVEDLAIDYSPELGWQAKLPNNENGLPVEAAIAPMKEGGWQIYVGSPEGTRLDAIPEPEMRVYLSPIKK